MKTAQPIQMWAIVVKATRSQWIHWHTIRMTRRDAIKAYCNQYTDPNHGMEHFRARQVRAAKVIVALSGGAS